MNTPSNANLTQIIAYGILWAQKACKHKDWQVWAENWLNGKDRTYMSAHRAAEYAATENRYGAARTAAEAAENAAIAQEKGLLAAEIAAHDISSDLDAIQFQAKRVTVLACAWRASGGEWKDMNETKCAVCDVTPMAFRWTDTHGIGVCNHCGAPYRILHYDESKLRITKPPECQLKSEWIAICRRYFEATGRMVDPAGFDVGFCDGSHTYSGATREDIELWQRWLLEHKAELPQGADEEDSDGN